jgi:eukaryotic-like serine/threonine-protein kinase
MTPADYQRAGDLFQELRELRESERVVALDAACAGNAPLRAQVVRLLEADREVASRSFLETRALEDAARLLVPEGRELPMPGTVIGNYQLGSRIGAGGMGVVYEGQDLHLHRRVAIKILPPSVAGEGEEMVKRFQREARAASLLNHPNILTIFDADFDQGHRYIASEFVEGKTLGRLNSEAPVETEDLMNIAVQLCSALAAAHEAGIVHRDIKPENIMIRPDGFVKVLDFGLAKMEHAAEKDSNLSRTGTVLGTLAYMSPEQAAGKPADARSDIFSLGAVLHEMLTGRHAVESENAARHQRLESAAVLERIVARCLARDPAERYQSATEVRTALEAARHAASASRQASIAVLPFVNQSGDKDSEYFGFGLADEILNLLARIQGLKVIARTSSFAFRGKEQDIRKIAEALDVRTILEGSVRTAASRVRVTAQLISAEDGSQLWSERYDREMTDVFALQDEMAAAIAGALQLKISARTRHAPEPAANEAYMKGISFVYEQTPEGLAHGREYFERAIALDPGYAEAQWALGGYYVSLTQNDFLPAREAVPRARAALARALEIDPSLAIAHVYLGMLACVYDYDWEEGKRRFQLADSTESIPAEMHQALAYKSYLLGQIPEAIEEVKRALDTDPLSLWCRQTFAYYLCVAGMRERALAELRRILEIDGNYWIAYVLIGRIHLCTGEVAQAIANAERAYEIAPWNARTIGFLAGLMIRVGNRQRAEELQARLLKLPPHQIPLGMVLYHVVALDIDAAAAWFEKAVEQRTLALFTHVRDPILEPLRQSAHWPRLVRLINLPEQVECAVGQPGAQG